MIAVPPIPSWDAVHPVLVHFPVALLLSAPLFVLASLLVRRHARPLSVVALAVLAAGTAFAQLAVMSGEAGEGAVKAVPAAEAVFENHEESAETARTTYLIITLVYGAAVIWPVVRRDRCPGWVYPAVAWAVLVAIVPASVMLANTAHLGGRLVHEYGVHAALGAGSGSSADAPAPPRKDDDD